MCCAINKSQKSSKVSEYQTKNTQKALNPSVHSSVIDLLLSISCQHCLKNALCPVTAHQLTDQLELQQYKQINNNVKAIGKAIAKDSLNTPNYETENLNSQQIIVNKSNLSPKNSKKIQRSRNFGTQTDLDPYLGYIDETKMALMYQELKGLFSKSNTDEKKVQNHKDLSKTKFAPSKNQTLEEKVSEFLVSDSMIITEPEKCSIKMSTSLKKDFLKTEKQIQKKTIRNTKDNSNTYNLSDSRLSCSKNYAEKNTSQSKVRMEIEESLAINNLKIKIYDEEKAFEDKKIDKKFISMRLQSINKGFEAQKKLGFRGKSLHSIQLKNNRKKLKMEKNWTPQPLINNLSESQMQKLIFDQKIVKEDKDNEVSTDKLGEEKLSSEISSSENESKISIKQLNEAFDKMLRIKNKSRLIEVKKATNRHKKSDSSCELAAKWKSSSKNGFFASSKDLYIQRSEKYVNKKVENLRLVDIQ